MCDIVNIEVEREKDYWVAKALENGDQSSLLANALKRRKLKVQERKQFKIRKISKTFCWSKN